VKLPELPPNEWMIFWVSDQGIGIPAQYHNRIFEKFGQIRGRKSRGTGLGLTFCKLAAESHSGQIWLESEENVGSTFALALPLMQEHENHHNH
jgi:signal transduction histidine kinase